jgi:hypothetical protein
MLPRRLAQSLCTLLAAAVAWLFLARWLDPKTAAIILGALAGLLILRILIRPLTFESWESFWEGLVGWLWWW